MPSGHALTTLVFLGLLVYIAFRWRREAAPARSGRRRHGCRRTDGLGLGGAGRRRRRRRSYRGLTGLPRASTGCPTSSAVGVWAAPGWPSSWVASWRYLRRGPVAAAGSARVPVAGRAHPPAVSYASPRVVIAGGHLRRRGGPDRARPTLCSPICDTEGRDGQQVRDDSAADEDRGDEESGATMKRKTMITGVAIVCCPRSGAVPGRVRHRHRADAGTDRRRTSGQRRGHRRVGEHGRGQADHPAGRHRPGVGTHHATTSRRGSRTVTRTDSSLTIKQGTTKGLSGSAPTSSTTGSSSWAALPSGWRSRPAPTRARTSWAGCRCRG